MGSDTEQLKSTTPRPTLILITAQGLMWQDVSSGDPRPLRAAGGGLTISRYSGVHRGFLSLSFCGCFQLLFQPADITVCLGLHDAQLRVDVFVLVTGVFLILAKEQEQPRGVRQTAGATGFVNVLKRSLANADGRSTSSGEKHSAKGNACISHTPSSGLGLETSRKLGPAVSPQRCPCVQPLRYSMSCLWLSISANTEFKQNSQKWPWQRGRPAQTRSDAGRLGRSLTLVIFAIKI